MQTRPGNDPEKITGGPELDTAHLGLTLWQSFDTLSSASLADTKPGSPAPNEAAMRML